jgi:hypothetical protein
VDDFVTSLTADQKYEVRHLLLSHMMTPSWPWYELIMNRYLKGPDARALLDDIEMHYPGAEFYNLAENTQGLPIHEAKMILREAQKALGK